MQDETRLVSRRWNVYKRFSDLAAAIHIELDCQAVLDGEIVCLDGNGRAQFYDLLRRYGEPVFYAFDVRWLDGEDLRSRPLLERMPEQPSVMLYAEHIEGYDVEFFRFACEQDLEGIVAKAKHLVWHPWGSRCRRTVWSAQDYAAATVEEFDQTIAKGVDYRPPGT